MEKTLADAAIVDDETSVRIALARLLSASSISASTFGSARSFIESLEISVPLCLILDIQMPEMDGIELLRYLAETGFDIPTVVITARNEPALRDQCYAAGAIAVLTKPIRTEALVNAIRSARGFQHFDGA